MSEVPLLTHVAPMLRQEAFPSGFVQGYLGHKNPPTPLGPPSGPNPSWNENWKVRFGFVQQKDINFLVKRSCLVADSVTSGDSNSCVKSNGWCTMPLAHNNLIAHSLKVLLPRPDLYKDHDPFMIMSRK